jgi:phenylacetate-CoA ligase
MLATPELLLEAALPQRLAEVMPRWLREVPLYSGRGVPFTLDEHAEALEQLGRLPFITKQDIRRNFPRNFLGAGAELEALLEQDLVELEHTSGTSEQRTPLLLPRGWWTEQEERALRLNPLVAKVLDQSPAARRLTLSSPVCSGEICYAGVPSREDRTLGNTLFASLSRYPFLWSERDLARIAGEAADWQPQFLDVDPVYGVVFALHCERRGIRFPSLRFILCSYEFLSVVHRHILERVFGVPVFDLYGATETGHLLMEDESGEYRPSLLTAFLQTTAEDEQGISELIATTLTNDFMPLLRYRIGDLVEHSVQPYGTRYVLHGRVADAFLTAGGRRVTTRQVDECFAGLSGIAHYQLIEEPMGPWRLRFVPHSTGPVLGTLPELEQRLIALLELPSGLVIQATDMLVPEGSGKFRLGYPLRRGTSNVMLEA